MEKDLIAQQIAEMALLKEGWDGYDGGPASEECIAESMNVYRTGKFLGYKAEIMPGNERGIVITFYQDDSDIFRIARISKSGSRMFSIGLRELSQKNKFI